MYNYMHILTNIDDLNLNDIYIQSYSVVLVGTQALMAICFTIDHDLFKSDFILRICELWKKIWFTNSKQCSTDHILI